MFTPRKVGSTAEKQVLAHYAALGYVLLAANFMSFAGKQVGEIDLVFRGPANQQHVRFVEVKARSSQAAALYIEALLPRFKRRRIAQTARYFMYSHPEHAQCYWHFDLAVVQLSKLSFDNSPRNITIVSDVNLD